jgi:hypothetical protein
MLILPDSPLKVANPIAERMRQTSKNIILSMTKKKSLSLLLLAFANGNQARDSQRSH